MLNDNQAQRVIDRLETVRGKIDTLLEGKLTGWVGINLTDTVDDINDIIDYIATENEE